MSIDFVWVKRQGFVCVRALSFAYVCIGQNGTCRFLGAGGYKVFRRGKWGVGVVV